MCVCVCVCVCVGVGELVCVCVACGRDGVGMRACVRASMGEGEVMGAE